MVITYLKSNNQVVSIIEGFPKIWEASNQLLIENGMCPLINDLTKAGWGCYEDEVIERQYDDNDIELPLYLTDLDLQPIVGHYLSSSIHVGKLKAIDVTKAKPVTITRRYLGQDYDVECLVTQSVVELYQSGKIIVGDFVLISFVEEVPNTVEIRVAIVIDKVYKSW